MKVAILHHDIEPVEFRFREFFENKGVKADFFDIREVHEEELFDYDLVFNRVYSSVASRDFAVLNKTLHILELLEA